MIAPFSGTPCLYYRIKCTAEWKDGDTNKSKVLDEQKVAAQFTIDDGSGPVRVDAREGGDFEPTQTKRETKGAGLLGGITGTELTFGSYRVQTGMLNMGTKYSVEEEILPVVPRLYACGKVADQGGVITAPGWRQLILSSKSRDELLASATKGAKIFLAAGAAAFCVGSGLAIVGQLTASDEDHAAAAIAPVTAKDAPPATSTAELLDDAPSEASDLGAAAPVPVGTAKPTSAGVPTGKSSKKK